MGDAWCSFLDSTEKCFVLRVSTENNRNSAYPINIYKQETQRKRQLSWLKSGFLFVGNEIWSILPSYIWLSFKHSFSAKSLSMLHKCESRSHLPGIWSGLPLTRTILGAYFDSRRLMMPGNMPFSGGVILLVGYLLCCSNETNALTLAFFTHTQSMRMTRRCFRFARYFFVREKFSFKNTNTQRT